MHSFAFRALSRPFSHATAALLCAAAALTAAPASAEPEGSVELGVFGGYDLFSATSELGNAIAATEVPGKSPLIGARVGFALVERLSLEAEAKYALAKFTSNGLASPVLGLRAHAMINILTDGVVRPFLTFGFGTEHLMAAAHTVSGVSALDNTDWDSATIVGAGSRFELAENFGIRLDYRLLLIPARENKKTQESEVHLGVYYRLGGKPRDTDLDGLPDVTDKCPTQPEDKDGFEDSDGCPDPDNDGDGILDAADKCPNEAENKNGFEDDDGCPDDPDSDGDGINDSKDKCPKQAENKNGFEDDDGCPDDPDTDGDGIKDSKDKCPKEPETKNGFQDEDGCPDVLDTDGDGIPDDKDKCPKEPETKNGYEDEDGCPDKIPEKLKKFTGAIQGIEFDVDKATIKSASFKILDGAVEVLAEFKDTKIEVSGHTDNTGAIDHNKELSLARANAVKAYFVTKGIAETRVLTVGYGPDKPVAENKTKKGQAKNRRIEFKLL